MTDFLDVWIGEHGKPAGIQVDNGTEFTSNHFDAWAYDRGIAVHFITPGRPVENAVIESFFATLKLEMIFRQTFRTRQEARLAIFKYIETFYNRQRRHSYLGYVSPVEFEELAKNAENAA